MTSTALHRELQLAIDIALEAAPIALRYFESKDFDVVEKANEQGPVTAADRAIDTFVRARLRASFPQDALASEETELTEHGERTWFVDPIDGTKSFVSGSSDFAIMIGLVQHGAPVLGVVYRPVEQLLYYARRGAGAFLRSPSGEQRLAVSERALTEGARAILSKSHPCARVDALLDQLGIVERKRMGSMGLKLCELARGEAELYLNLSGKPCQWDVAAAQAILEEAGGWLSTAKGTPILYDAQHIQLTDGAVASNLVLHDAALALLKDWP